MVILGSLETQQLFHLDDVSLELHSGAENGAMGEVWEIMGQWAYRRWSRGSWEGERSMGRQVNYE